MNGKGARALIAAIVSLTAIQAAASSLVKGTLREHAGPRGTVERCVAVARMPGGVYTEADAREEEALCAIDFHAGGHALCPKVFSTSPGTLVYALAGAPGPQAMGAFERVQCASKAVKKEGATGAPVSFKMSVNSRHTSATFANAALVYYHFARYFAATAHVPVAVLRTMDRQEHRQRIAERGMAMSAESAALRMNHAAWEALVAAEKDPARYTPTEELFSADGQVYGVLLRPLGSRYSEELNGTRASGWGDGQNRDFQQTAPFLALRVDKPLAEAIEEGKRAAFRDPRIARATAPDADPRQIAFWMSALVDITLLDFLFGQQDRVGNIDYLPTWHWIEDGRLVRRAAEGRTPPADLAAHAPLMFKRTELGDNDAGLRIGYVNYAKRTGMLEGLRHYRAGTYERLMRLHRDFGARGPLHEHVRTSFGLSEREFRNVVDNTAAAARLLHAACAAGELRFDVEADEFFVSGEVEPRRVECGSL
jgi:hypothetical protein